MFTSINLFTLFRYLLFTFLNFSCLWIFDIFVCLFIYLTFLVCLFLFTCLLPVSGWLKDGDDELIRRVSLRIEDVTGLTMDTAEELQVFTVLPRDQAGKIFTLLKKKAINLFADWFLIDRSKYFRT